MKKYTKLIGICIIALAAAGALWLPKSSEAAAPSTTHQYEITVAAKAVDEEGNPIDGENTYGGYSDDGLAAIMTVASGESETKAKATVHDVDITTADRDKCLEAGNLESTIIEKAGATFSDGAEGASITGVSGTDTIKYLSPTEGYAGCTVKLKVSGGGVSGGFIETNVYVTYVKDEADNEKKEDEENAKNDEKASGDDGSSISVNDGSENEEDDEELDDEGDGGIDSSSSTKKKSNAEKEKLKKQTAKISLKEREKDKAIAVAPGAGEDGGSGPDPITVSIFALAAVIAAAFYRWIRSDLKIIRWHEQKKALRKP